MDNLNGAKFFAQVEPLFRVLQVELLKAVAVYFPPKGVPLGTLPKGSIPAREIEP